MVQHLYDATIFTSLLKAHKKVYFLDVVFLGAKMQFLDSLIRKLSSFSIISWHWLAPISNVAEAISPEEQCLSAWCTIVDTMSNCTTKHAHNKSAPLLAVPLGFVVKSKLYASLRWQHCAWSSTFWRVAPNATWCVIDKISILENCWTQSLRR